MFSIIFSRTPVLHFITYIKNSNPQTNNQHSHNVQKGVASMSNLKDINNSQFLLFFYNDLH